MVTTKIHIEFVHNIYDSETDERALKNVILAIDETLGDEVSITNATYTNSISYDKDEELAAGYEIK